MKNENKLKGKDLINIGIYAALTCVLITAVSMIGFVPVLLPMIGILAPLVAGIPLMLFMTKVRKFGMITIMGLILGGFLWLTGMGYWPFLFGAVLGLLADLICKAGKYNSPKMAMVGHGVLSVTYFGCMLPLYLDIEAYFSTRQGFGQEYEQTVAELLQPWTLPALIIGGFVAGVAGARIGQKLLKKHFPPAGIV